MRYVLPDGRADELLLSLDENLYHDYLQYTAMVTGRFTGTNGSMKLWLTAFDATSEIILKTGEATVPIKSSEDITSYFSESELSRLDAVDMQLLTLDNKKADSIIYDPETYTISLLANGTPVGEPLDVTMLPGEGGSADIPPATASRLGLVRGSDGTDKIAVESDGTMSINAISISNLVQAPDEEIIFDAGKSS